jgi:serine/threonine-protein kinase RsbW
VNPESAPALSLTITSTMASVGPLGERVRATCLGLGLGEGAAREVELSVVEVVNNTIEHAYQLAEDGKVWVTLGRRASRLQIEVRDRGRPMPPETLARVRVPRVDPGDPGSLPEGGMGLFIITELMDAVRYESHGGENVLVMERSIDRAARSAAPPPPRRT